jgi:predicted metalloprotease with PDZ domain
MLPKPIRFHLAMPEPQSHEFHVTMEIPALPQRQTLDIVFPAWAPGSYLVRDFARHVYDLTVRQDDTAVPCERLDKARWRLRSQGRAVTLRYRVFAFETSVRTSFLDDSHAFVNGTSLFFFVDGEIQRPHQVRVAPPKGWHISTPLPALRGQRNGFGAHDYDELVDSPIEIGTHELHAFRLNGTRFEVAFQGRSNIDKKRMLADLRAIAQTTGSIFGGFPFQRYLFIIHALPARGGGLEHACSSTLDIAGFAFEDEKAYQAFHELTAHEFLHAWNVKRIHDRALGPFDYTKENYTRLLWFHEGFTEYMQGLILVRAGLLSPERYLKDLAEDWTRYIARPGRNVTPLSELSYEAWIKQYKPADNHTNRMVSYYDKGRWAGLLLDLRLRADSNGRRGVPDLFRRLWSRHGARDRAIDATIIRQEAEALAGHSLADYFRHAIDGTAELPIPKLLRATGITVEALSPAEHERHDAVKAGRNRAWSGLVFNGSDRESAVVKNVVPGSPAWQAGITYGDELIAVDDNRVHGGTVGKRLADGQPGQEMRISFFRKDRLLVSPLRLARNPEQRWTFSANATAPAQQRLLRNRWLGTTG